MKEEELQTSERHKFATNKSRKQIFMDNFIGGLAWGVGSIIGATIIVGVLGLIITGTKEVPLLGDFVKIITQEIQNGKDEVFNNDK